MPDIIKITPIEDVFSITWNLHKRCNNNCMYCGEFLHDNVSPVKSLETLQQYWIQVFEKTKHIGKPYKISFTGGEPTINKNFLPFVEWLKLHYSQYLNSVRLTSNGTASANYYVKLFEHLSSLTLSTHTESFNFEKFTQSALTCHQYAQSNPDKFFMVNIMEEYWAVDIIKQLIDFFRQHNIKFSLNKINYHRKGSRTFPIFIKDRVPTPRPDLEYDSNYTQTVHKQLQEYAGLTDIPEDEFYNITVDYSDGSSIKTYATRLNFLGLNKFQGWKCHAGLYRINIGSSGTVYDGECYNEILGSLEDNTFQLRNTPGICLQKNCTGNPDDIMIPKSLT